MIISPPFLPAPNADDHAFIASAMVDSRDIAPGSGGAPLGSYPLTTAMTWHNGLHLEAPKTGEVRLPVRAIADGTVIFLSSPTAVSTEVTHPQNYNPYGIEPAWTDNGMVIISHTTEIGASATGATVITFYSVYMHLSLIDASLQANRRIFRRNTIGTAGSILGREGQIHFEICLSEADLQRLLGSSRATSWAEPFTAPVADGRTDAVFGNIYVYLPAGTPTSANKPATNVRTSTSAVQGGVQANGPLPNTLGEAQWVEIRYDGGNGVVTSLRAAEGVTLQIGLPNPESAFDYNLYTEANARHNSLPAAEKSLSTPSAWYELLRFGRNLGDGTNSDALPVNAAHWREVPTVDGTVWVDLNAENTRKFSDADFPLQKHWQCFDDDTSHDNQRCDSLQIKRMIRDPQLPETIREREILAKRLGLPSVRQRFISAICKFPSEWDKSTIKKRYEWLKVDEEFKIERDKEWREFTAHADSITFDSLPSLYTKAHWHFHPRAFIEHMRKCGWLSMEEMSQVLSGSLIETTSVSSSDAIRRLSDGLQGRNTNMPAGLHKQLNIAFRKYGLSSRLRQAHFFAQCFQETGALSFNVELGNDRYFRTMYEKITPSEAGEDYDDRQSIAWRLGYVYHTVSRQRVLYLRSEYLEVRPAQVRAKAQSLGNVREGDGPRFRGRGLIQLTGRNNYVSYEQYRGANYTTDPHPVELAANAAVSVDVASKYWVNASAFGNQNINRLADRGNSRDIVESVTRAVNGGLTHIEERVNYFKCAWNFFKDTAT